MTPAATVREVRLVPVPTIPESDRWTAAEQATAARVLSHQLAEMLSTYGSGVTLDALAAALAGDMREAAYAIRAPRLAANYTAAAVMLRGMGETLQQAEEARR